MDDHEQGFPPSEEPRSTPANGFPEAPSAHPGQTIELGPAQTTQPVPPTPPMPLTPPIPPIPPMSPFGAAETSQASQGEAQPASTPDVENAGGAPPAAPHTEDGPQAAEREAQPHAETPPNEPRLRIDIELVTGDLVIVGGAPRVRVTTSGDDDYPFGVRDADTTSGYIRLADLPDDSEVRVPDGCEVRVRHVEGDLRAERLDALLIVRGVDGDVELDRVAVVDLDTVDGDVSAERGGSLRVRTVSGDVRVDDYGDAVLLGSVAGDVHFEHAGEVAIRDGAGGDVIAERVGDVTLNSAGGDVRVERAGRVRARSIGGDVRIEEVTDALLQSLGGDLKASDIGGALNVNAIGGDVRLRGVRGTAHFGSTGGDLEAQHIPGGLVVGHVGGDVTLETRLGAGADYDVHAAGDIVLRVRGEVSARFVAQTLGGEIRTHLPLTVERGRRRNLVGVLGGGSAAVTLRSDGGDILITGGDRDGGNRDMNDDTNNTTNNTNENTTANSSSRGTDTRTWEGRFGGQRFRVRMDRGPDRAGLHFEGPLPEGEAEAASGSPRDFGIEWQRGQGARTYGEYEQRLRELGEKAEDLARRAADQAQAYAEKAARRARETDWEAVGRDVRNAVEKAMADLESAFNQVRGEWETRRPGGPSTSSRPNAQRVRIEQDEPGAGTSNAGAAFGGTFTQADQTSTEGEREVGRREILEQLRLGAISIEEAERRLNALK